MTKIFGASSTTEDVLSAGFSLSLGLTLLWTGLIVILPLTALLLRPWQHGVGPMIHALYDARMHAALRGTDGFSICDAACRRGGSGHASRR